MAATFLRNFAGNMKASPEMNLFELFAEAQKGAAMRNFGAMYGLPPDKTQALVAAYLPAFAQGLGRKAHDPFDFATFMRDHTTPAMQRFYENMTPETVDPARKAGEQLMEQIFGRNAPRRMARAASQVTGVPESTAEEFLAPMAATLAGGVATHMAMIPGLHEWVDALTAQRDAELAAQAKARAVKALEKEIREQERLEKEARERATKPGQDAAARMGDMMKTWTTAAMSANPFMSMLDHGQIPEPEVEPEPEAPEEEKHPMAAFFDLFDPGVMAKGAESVLAAMQPEQKPKAAKAPAEEPGEPDEEPDEA